MFIVLSTNVPCWLFDRHLAASVAIVDIKTAVMMTTSSTTTIGIAVVCIAAIDFVLLTLLDIVIVELRTLIGRNGCRRNLSFI